MKVPCLPLSIDSFGGPAAAPSPRCPLFLLSHFHTDHMKGLSSNWCAGIIVCSEVTRALVLQRFSGQQELDGRVVALPLWRRTALLQSVSAVLGQRPHNPDAHSADSAAEGVFVTLLPAFHIPGSVMFYLETPLGNILYTGDFKFEEGSLAPTVMRAFFASHAVDHLYVDDTWLHLGVEVVQAGLPRSDGASYVTATTSNAQGEEGEEDLFRVFDDVPAGAGPSRPVVNTSTHAGSGAKVLSKLLNREQTAEAIEAIGRRMDYQRQQFALWRHQQGGAAPAQSRIFPFKLRVYLHNQFGKELLIQQLATRLGTRALIDDDRYDRLALVAARLNEVTLSGPPSVTSTDTDSSAAHIWEARGGEMAQYPLQLDRFVSYSQYRRVLDDFDSGSGGRRLGPDDVTRLDLPLIEVVSSRAKISDDALEEASAASFGAPFYGVVISGWARLQRRRGAPERIWHVPTTLHCAPDECIRFVELLRPLSITPLHYRPSRAAVILQRLGPLLRTPFVNRYLTAPGEPGGVAPAAAAYTLHAGRRWVTPLPAVAEVSNAAVSELGRAAMMRQEADSEEDALATGGRKGFRLRVCPANSRSPADACTWVGPGSAATPSRRMETIVQTLSAARKRPRPETDHSCFSLDALADLVEASASSRGNLSASTSRAPSLPLNTVIL